MEYLDRLKEMLCGELEDISMKGEMSAGDLETIHKLTDTIKNIDKIEGIEENGYSMDWEPYASTGARRSYRSRGYSGQRRDSMGRYSRDGGNLKEQIRMMMDDGSLTSEERAVLKQAMNQL